MLPPRFGNSNMNWMPRPSQRTDSEESRQMVIETSAFLNRVPLRLQMGHLHGMAENEIVRKELQY